MLSLTKKNKKQIDQYQLNAAKQQLLHCARHIKYYQQLFTQLDFMPESIRSLDDIQRLPILRKEDIRADQMLFRGKDYLSESVNKSYSSGSTGQPFATYFDKSSWYRKKFFTKLRARFACGMRIGERVAILECEDQAVVDKRNKHAWLTDAFLKVRVFSLFQDKHVLLQQLREFKPASLYAYPSHLLELAGTSDGQAIDGSILPSVQRLFTSSEFLESGMRRFIEARFDAEIFDHYGSTEFKEIAWECPQHGYYHINYDEVLCELVNDQGKNIAPSTQQAGELLITDLRNKAMPLVRFSLGDHAVVSDQECACGYQGLSLKPLGGRCSDYLILTTGEQLSPYRFTTEIEHIAGLLQYQIIQRNDTTIEVLTVWGTASVAVNDADVFEQHQRAIDSILRKAVTLGSSALEAAKFEINVTRCASINNEENGKFKVVKRLF